MENIKEQFNDEIIQKVWAKGRIIQNYDSKIYRQDECTAWMKFEEYGNRNSILGWEIDHTDCNRNNNKFENLRPLQWKNNLDKSDGKLKCNILSKENKNIDIKEDR